MRQKLAALAITGAVGGIAVAVLYVPASVPSPAVTPAELGITGSRVPGSWVPGSPPRAVRAAAGQAGVPGSGVPGSEVPGSPPRALRAAAGQAGFPGSRVPGSEVPEAQERLDVLPALESRPVTASVKGELAMWRTGDVAISGSPMHPTVSRKGGAMTTAGKAMGKAFGTAGRSAAAAFRKAF